MRHTIFTACLLATLTAAGSDFKGGIFEYTITSPTTATVMLAGKEGDFTNIDTTKIEFPATVNFRGHQLTVTVVEWNPTVLLTVDTIVLPSTLREVGPTVFHTCQAKTVILPDSLKKIGEYSFQGCQIETLRLPAGLTDIGSGAFSYNSLLKEVHFSEGLTTIGSQAFAYCEQLTELDFPASLKTISQEAFAGCTGLKRIATHGPMDKISYMAFSGDSSLETVEWGGSVKELSGFNGCTSLAHVTIPAGTQTIGMSAFNGCEALSELIIPNDVSSIGGYALWNCTGLKELVLPSAMTQLEDWVLGCQNLESLTIGENTGWIGNAAFDGCTNLKRITVRSMVPAGYVPSTLTQETLDLFGRAELIVPTGRKDVYAKAEFWENFRTIGEQDMGTLYDVLAIHVGEGGTLGYNGQVFTPGDTTILVPQGESLTFTVMPDEAHQLSLLEQRYDTGIDYLNNLLKDGQVTIGKVKSNGRLWATFEDGKAAIDILQNEMGRVRLMVMRNQKYGYRVKVEDGWKLNSITYDGEDITDMAGGEGYLVTPVVKGDAVIRLAFEQTTDIRHTEDRALRVLGSDEGIIVEHALQGEPISIYTLDGRQVVKATATGAPQQFALRTGVVYIVKTRSKTIKIRL